MDQPSKQIELLEKEGFGIINSGYKIKTPIVKNFKFF